MLFSSEKTDKRFFLEKHKKFFKEVYDDYKTGKINDPEVLKIIENCTYSPACFYKLYIQLKGISAFEEEYFLMFEEFKIISETLVSFLKEGKKGNICKKNNSEDESGPEFENDEEQIKISFEKGMIFVRKEGKVLKIMEPVLTIVDVDTNTVFEHESIIHNGKKYILANTVGKDNVKITEDNFERFKEIFKLYVLQELKKK